MGAKINEDHVPGGNGHGPTSSGTSSGGEPRGVHLARDGDGALGDGGDDDDDDQDQAAPITSDQKKKKRKPRKKKKKRATTQSSPPRVPLIELFPSGDYPTGELLLYDVNTSRTTGAERRLAARKLEEPTFLSNYRQAAEVHRQVRHWVQDTVKPGHTLTEIATGIEDAVRALLGNQGLDPGDALRSGMGFPTGLSLNQQVAHYTPNPGQKDIVLQHSDVMKVDFGVHINGWIVDSAFTMSFDRVYDPLLAAVKEATNAGIKAAGVDVRICDVSAAIEEAMSGYEVEIGGKTYPVRPVRDLRAHDIRQYKIHGEKSIPFTRNDIQTKMEEGEVFAIETFGTTGRGRMRDDQGIYGYALRPDAPKKVDLPFASATKLHKVIRDHFGTIPFCRRYLERLGVERYLAGLNCLVANGVLEAYEPLTDIPGSYSAQFEHTILLREERKEVLSRGDDY